MSNLVVDASVSAVWIIEDENHPVADLALEAVYDNNVIVPQLWHYEIRNVLLVAERRGRVRQGHLSRYIVAINRLPIRTDENPDLDTVMALAREHNLTFYDAVYLEVALRRSAELATLDRSLAKAAEAEEVSVWLSVLEVLRRFEVDGLRD